MTYIMLMWHNGPGCLVGKSSDSIVTGWDVVMATVTTLVFDWSIGGLINQSDGSTRNVFTSCSPMAAAGSTHNSQP